MGAHRKHTSSVAATTLTLLAITATTVTAPPAFADITATAEIAPSINWDPITHCESGGNPTAHNATSSASGLYQFLTSTWLHYGGGQFAPTAAQATPAQQTIVANRAYAANGLADWVWSRGCWGDELGTILGGSKTPVPVKVVVTKPTTKTSAPPLQAELVLTPKAAAPKPPKAAPKPAVKPVGAPVALAPKHAATETAGTHTVVTGDTLWDIAPDHNWKALYADNAAVVGSNPDLIYPGQRLRV